MDNGLLEGSVLTNHGLFHRSVVNSLLDHGTGGIFSDGLIGNSGLVFNLMFHLLIVSIRDLNGGVIGVLDGLIIGEGFSDFNLFTQSSHVSFKILTLIRNGLI